MERRLPHKDTECIPCFAVVMYELTHHQEYLFQSKWDYIGIDNTGYTPLAMVKGALADEHYIVKHYKYYKQRERVALMNFPFSNGATYVVCVEGHYVLVENGYYTSWFWNEHDKVIAIWEVEKI